MSPPNVLILGAGLAGLTLAQTLRKQGIPFQIFERDENLHAREGGWAIGIHTILDELKASVPSSLPDLESTCSHLRPLDLPAQLCFYDGTKEPGQRLQVQSSAEQPVLRADRQRLREWLATDIAVQWGKHVKSIEQGPDGKVRLEFADGAKTEGDVLVGADGVSSQVRHHLLPDTHTSTVPICIINGETRLNREQMRRQLQLGHSSYVAGGADMHLFVGLASTIPSTDTVSAAGSDPLAAIDGGKYYFYLNVHSPVEPNSEHGNPFWTATASKEDMHAFVVQKTSVFHPRFQEIVQSTPVEGIRQPPIVIRDLGLTSIPEGNITLIGDAAHPMTPFRGEGGTNALMDALNLGRLLGSDLSVQDALDQYAKEMLPRGREAVEKSRAVGEKGDVKAMVAWGQDVKQGVVAHH